MTRDLRQSQTPSRTRYTVSVGTVTVHCAEIDAPDADDALAQAQSDWNGKRSLDWYEVGAMSFEPPLFQIEDAEAIGDSDSMQPATVNV